MLLQSQVPQSMWHEAALHAFSLLNVLPLWELLLGWIGSSVRGK
jgi:hypothetical protein